MRSLGKSVRYPPRPVRLPLHRSNPIGPDPGSDFRLGDTILAGSFATGAYDHGADLQVKVRFGEDDD